MPLTSRKHILEISGNMLNYNEWKSKKRVKNKFDIYYKYYIDRDGY